MQCVKKTLTIGCDEMKEQKAKKIVDVQIKVFEVAGEEIVELYREGERIEWNGLTDQERLTMLWVVNNSR